MTWAKLDDQFPTHPKVMRAGPEAAWLFVAGLCYAAQHLTDGMIPKCAVNTLVPARGARLAQTLVKVGLWEELADDYVIHDYLAYNPSRDEVVTERERKKEGGRRGAANRWSGMSDRSSHSSSHDTNMSRKLSAPTANGDAPVPVPVLQEKENGRRKRRPPVDYEPTPAQQDFAREHGLDLEAERAHWLDWCDANGRTYSNVHAGFSTWLRQAVKFGRGRPPVMELESGLRGLVLPPSHHDVCPVCESSVLACRCGEAR